ncbi:MAG: DUF87 domain-containing protein, partial [Candidatus Micrarchaeota archaeon]|nr:DUF87 domain-containing protein [Candidatus Micrarchaeota archaeon]
PHLAVVGMTGSGKSYFVKAFISRAYRQWGTHALILDWAGEYAPWVERTGGLVVRLGKEQGFNLLDCRQTANKTKSISSTPQSRIAQVMAALALLTDLSAHPKEQRLTQAALEQAYSKKRLALQRPVSSRLPPARLPTLRDALLILRAQSKRRHDDAAEAAAFRLEPFCRPGADFLCRPGGLAIDSLVGRGLVSIDLSGLPSEAHRSLAGLTVLQFLKERMRDQGWSPEKGLKLLVVADEAWKIAQDDTSDLVAILREGRKFAFGLIVASQNPTDLSPTILSNAGTLLSFRLMHSNFRDSLAQSLQCPPQTASELERFAVGQALARLAFERPGAHDGPFVISRIEGEEPPALCRMEVEGMDIELDREELHKRLWRLGCNDAQISQVSARFEQHDRSLPLEELARQLLAFGLSRSVVLSFLRELDVPDSDLVKLFARLAARSLGASPSQIVELVVANEKPKRN